MPSVKDLGGGRWKLQVSLGRDATGRYRRTTKVVRATSKRNAEQQAHQWEADLDVIPPGERNATVGQVAAEWLALWRRATKPAAKTAAEYERIVAQHVTGADLGRQPVRTVRPGDLDVFYAGLRTATGPGRPKEQRPLSAASLRRVHAVVRQVFDHAERRGLVARSPAVKVRLPRLDEADVRIPTEDELAAIITAAWGSHPARARMLVFAAGSGLRRGELAAVRWSRLEVDVGSLMVARAISEVRGEVTEKDPKAHQALDVELTPVAVAAGVAQMEWQRAEAKAAGVRLAADPFLWSLRPPFSEPPKPSTLTGVWTRARAKAAVSGVRLHDLRHWHGTTLAVQGTPLADVQRQLRHKSMATTMRYLHEQTAEVRRQAVRQLPRLELPGGDASPAEG